MCAYLVIDVVERRAVVTRKHDENHVRLVIAQRPEAVKVFLAGSVPESQLDVLGRIRRVLDDRDQVLEYSRHVVLDPV